MTPAKWLKSAIGIEIMVGFMGSVGWAQDTNQAPPPQYPPPAPLTPQQLDQLIGPVALYPDGLLAQVLTAATYSNQIPDAAAWANAHQYLRGDALAQAIRADDLNFDPSVMHASRGARL